MTNNNTTSNGKKVSESKITSISFESAKEKRLAQQIADRNGCTLSELVRQLVLPLESGELEKRRNEIESQIEEIEFDINSLKAKKQTLQNELSLIEEELSEDYKEDLGEDKEENIDPEIAKRITMVEDGEDAGDSQ